MLVPPHADTAAADVGSRSSESMQYAMPPGQNPYVGTSAPYGGASSVAPAASVMVGAAGTTSRLEAELAAVRQAVEGEAAFREALVQQAAAAQTSLQLQVQ